MHFYQKNNILEYIFNFIKKTMNISSIQSLPILIGIWLIWIVILWFCANKTVEKSINIARYFWRSEIFIWLTILSIWTSIPEISSNIIWWFGILLGKLDYHIASATVIWWNVWSSVVQLTFITWLLIVFMWRLKLKREFIMENYVTLIVTFLFMFIVWYDWMITRSESALMLLVFCLYLYFLYLQERKHQIKEHPHRDSWKHTPRKDAWWIVLWFIGVFVWSSTSLESLQQIVIITWFSWWLLAIMTLWVASALPEFITSISALRKWAADVGLWTLIWSNIVNPLMWIWAGWIITWYAVPQWFTGIDLPIQIIVSCVLLLRIIHHKRVIPKYAGYILMWTYFFYLLARMYLYPTDFANY